MPELPEVESARKLVESACAGRAISRVVAVEQGGGPRSGLFDECVCENIRDAGELESALLGRKLQAVSRKGKQMWWTLSGAGRSPTFHLGMTGHITVKQPGVGAKHTKYKNTTVDTSSWPPRFCKLEVMFDDGTRLAFTDPRRFARITLEAEPAMSAKVSGLGPDAYLDKAAITPAWFAASLGARSVAVKALLLDQGWVAGIGNWIADEVLYQAGVHPETPANALSPDDAQRLRAVLFAVVDHAVAVDADADRFPPSWLFHYRWGKGKGPAKMPSGHPIEFVTVGGRTSAVVRAVQGGVKRAVATSVMAKAAVGPAGSSSVAVVAATVQSPAAAAAAAPSRKRKQPSGAENTAPTKRRKGPRAAAAAAELGDVLPTPTSVTARAGLGRARDATKKSTRGSAAGKVAGVRVAKAKRLG